MKLVIVSGLSGSGKSIALETLEDCGYYCMDNLPVSLLEPFVRQAMAANQSVFALTAISIDARNQGHSLDTFPETLKLARSLGIQCEIVFLQADRSTLLKRFSETRRKHPLTDAMHSLAEAMELERQVLEPVFRRADIIIDTTYTNVHQLRELVRGRVNQAGQHLMSLYFQSFGFKHGIPMDTDFVYDVRCLPNPHWDNSLRPLTGKDEAVALFLQQHPEVARYQWDITDFMERWIPNFERENRSYLSIAIGCTGGQHRSVFLVEQIGAHFRTLGYNVLLRHRELSHTTQL
ncbi:MAG: RNase adapter RapZ [Pseudomonadota bacterium]|jgi:UPF0042 nucleotide-binding protein